MSGASSSAIEVNSGESPVTYEALKDLCRNNAEYFKNDNSENGQRLYLSFLAISDNIEEFLPTVFKLNAVVANYDFDEKTPANGYRSFLNMIDCAVKYAIQLNKTVCLKRDSVLFRKSNFSKEVESYAQLFASLGSCLKLTEAIRESSPSDELFPFENITDERMFILLSGVDTVNQYCFHGRCLGFQFCDSMRAALRFISLGMAIFSEAYYSEGSLLSKATTSFVNSTKYFTDPEEKAKRIVNISQNADIGFCKAFWFLSESELMKHLPSVVAHKVAVSKVIHIPTEPLSLNINGKEVHIPIPTSHIGHKAVQVRLICCKNREGMIGQANNKTEPASRGLFFHCHGGGFVAQSSCSHEVYLRQWATDLDVPILSIDYSLAPEAPFPRALEETLYAYCWALKNCHLLGSTGERIVAGGDSAGANLVTSLSLKCIDLGIPPPMGLFLAYAPFFVNLAPSPARLLCLADPLLPYGFLMRCLKAYTYNPVKPNDVANGGVTSDTESFEEISESDLVDLQAHKSPVSDASDTLTYASLTSPSEENMEGKVSEVEIIDANTLENDVSSQKFVTSFLEKYGTDDASEGKGTGTNVKKDSECSCGSETFNTPTNEAPLQNRVSDMISSLKGRFENFVPSKNPSGAVRCLDNTRTNILDEFKFTVPKNPLISPYCASDDALRQLPPVKILTVHMDPCLDDCIMFARKLKKLDHNVTVDVLDRLPHGFLNFSLVSKEAYEASKLCCQRIRELLDLDGLPPIV